MDLNSDGVRDLLLITESGALIYWGHADGMAGKNPAGVMPEAEAAEANELVSRTRARERHVISLCRHVLARRRVCRIVGDHRVVCHPETGSDRIVESPSIQMPGGVP